MKIIRQENFRVDGSLANKINKIDLPSEDESIIASLLSKRGIQLVTYWFDAERRFFSDDTASQIRNRAGTEIYQTQGTSSRKVEFDENMMTTTANSYRDLEWSSAEYTIFFVGRLGAPFFGGGGNTSVLGHNEADEVLNLPSLNIAASGTIRVPSTHTHGAPFLAQYVADTSLLRENFLITATLSEKGCAIRFNGVEVSRNTKPLEAGIGKFRLWGENFTASQFNGTVGSTIICEDDLSGSTEIDFIEAYLMNKYKIQK